MVNQSLFVVRRRIDVYFHFIGNRKRKLRLKKSDLFYDLQSELYTFIKRNVYNLFGQPYDIHTQLYMLPTEQQTKPFLRHCLQQFTALFISVNTIFLHNTPFDETTKIAKYSQKSHSNAFQLFSKHRNDLTPFKLFPRLILFQLIQPVDNLLQHCRSNGLFNIGILYGRTGNGRLEHVVQAWENNGLHLSVTIL